MSVKETQMSKNSEEMLEDMQEIASKIINDSRSSRDAVRLANLVEKFDVHMRTGGTSPETWRGNEMHDDRQELDTVRAIIDEELYEWGEYPLGQKPGYLAPIAGDAGEDIFELNRLIAAMKKAEHKSGSELDRLHGQVQELVEALREQVKNASLDQIEKYTRAREKWIDS